MSQPLTVGTAGHIDHGKTALVRALTGRDTDRLAEEKRRGISIELGFAELDLGDRRLSLIDVPGHERFVRTMIAGAGGIDLFLMAVAADDGVMPQTVEHAIVLKALGLEAGVIALTKCDFAEEDAIAKAAHEANLLLPEVPLLEVSSRTGAGIEQLRRELAAAAARIDGQRDRTADPETPVVLHVDRVFTVAGHGTVVTGTLRSGIVRGGSRLVVLPRGEKARVRAIQVHDRLCDHAGPHQRVALNLAGVGREQVERGDVIASLDAGLRPSYRLDVELAFSADQLAAHERVQVHHGTREAPGRMVPIDGATVQLRLEAPLIAGRGDHVVLRRIAPADTLGGATVLDPLPPRRSAHTQVRPVAKEQVTRARVASHAKQQISEGSAREAESPIVPAVLACLQADGMMPRGSRALGEALQISHAEVLAALDHLVSRDEVTRVQRDVWFPAAQLRELEERAVLLARPSGGITVADLRDALGITRKYAVAVLEHLGSTGVMIRRGERHELRRRIAGRSV
jgi:selenocysteine-specific elongation factor